MLNLKPKVEYVPLQHVTYDPLVSGNRFFLIRAPKIVKQYIGEVERYDKLPERLRIGSIIRP